MKKYPKAVVFLLLLPLVIAALSRPLSDYGWYVMTARGWIAGETRLYDGFTPSYYTPWAYVPFIPLAVLPDRVGQFIFNALSLFATIWATAVLSKATKWSSLALAICNLYTAILILCGQWDGIVLLSIALGWVAVEKQKPWLLGLAILGMTTKPTNILLPLILLAIAVSKWRFADLVRASVPLGVAVLLSFLSLGLDWPLRYVQFLWYFGPPASYKLLVLGGTVAEYGSSLRDYTGPYWLPCFVLMALGVLVWLIKLVRQYGVNRRTLYLSLVANLILSPYAMVYHFIYVSPAMAEIVERSRGWGAFLYGIGLLEFASLLIGVPLIYS
jgi:hypothetical protein